jgi:2-dehydro-3-deoxyphosphooctonate aldolase (KDO 8-P synthase)
MVDGLSVTDRTVAIGQVVVGPGRPLAVIAGPCVIESLDHCLRVGERAAAICRKLRLGYVFKASFDKANRTSVTSYRGPGLQEGLATLEKIRDRLGVPVLSDIHEPAQAAPAARVLDCLQIPAFLCRQTDLVVAAAGTGKPLNIKKGQFVSPQEMQFAVAKAKQAGNEKVLLCERGTFFGYGRLVNDFTGLAIMRQWAPVVFDVTHSTQEPGVAGGVSGGNRHFTPLLARAAVAAGCDALFLEIHDDPARAKSDAATVWPVERLEPLLRTCEAVHEAAGK